jgi:ribosomal biogenesis protein LAS1
MLGEQVRKEAGKAKTVPVARPAGKNRVSKPIPRTESRGTTTQLSAKLLEHGWGLLEKWDSRPLGVVASN